MSDTHWPAKRRVTLIGAVVKRLLSAGKILDGMGGRILVDVRILVDGRPALREGHRIAERVRRRVIDQLPGNADVLVCPRAPSD